MSRIGTNGREDWIICQARERSPAERAAFLDGACAGDMGLRERIEALLAAPNESDPLLTTQASVGRTTVKVEFPDGQPDEAVGQTLGRYKLLEKVGEGGCGSAESLPIGSGSDRILPSSRLSRFHPQGY